MQHTVIKAENISKRYRIGVLNSGSLKQDIYASWGKIFRNNDYTKDNGSISASHIWALKDINFEINRGDTIGFVGRNGAGKSTLLKLLSRITLPTTGTVKGIGRIASLLEVGTGFHPELTGRENVLLNGQILGMKKKEIIAKFDEIVDFAGVGKFINTPVKRYSSGMYLRLSFAVAANLDPDILIVDEALAVGDTEFQSKCMAKMKEVSTRDGKTVLFVSHNMPAIRNLCKRAFYIEKGEIIQDGDPDTVIANYLRKEKLQFFLQQYDTPAQAPGNEYIGIKRVEIVPRYDEIKIIDTSTALDIYFDFWKFEAETNEIMVGIHIFDMTGTCLFDLHSTGYKFTNGLISGSCTIPGNFLNNDSYYISFDFIKNKTERIYYFEGCLCFDIQNRDHKNPWFEKWNGYTKPGFPVLLNYNSYEF